VCVTRPFNNAFRAHRSLLSATRTPCRAIASETTERKSASPSALSEEVPMLAAKLSGSTRICSLFWLTIPRSASTTPHGVRPLWRVTAWIYYRPTMYTRLSDQGRVHLVFVSHECFREVNKYCPRLVSSSCQTSSLDSQTSCSPFRPVSRIFVFTGRVHATTPGCYASAWFWGPTSTHDDSCRSCSPMGSSPTNESCV
jgi:hypothetical protein